MIDDKKHYLMDCDMRSNISIEYMWKVGRYLSKMDCICINGQVVENAFSLSSIYMKTALLEVKKNKEKF